MFIRFHRCLLVKFIKDAESRNELLLAFGFSFLLGYYIGNCIVSFLFYHKGNKKISVEIKLVIKDYNDATATTENSFDKFLHSEKTGKKEIWAVWTWPHYLFWWSEIQTLCWGYGRTFFSRKSFKLTFIISVMVILYKIHKLTMKLFLIAILRVMKIALAIRQCRPPLKQSVTTFIFRLMF